MATAENKTEATAAAKPTLVPITVPRRQNGQEPNLIIGFNGKNWLIPRGQTSMVPPYIAAEYERSLRAADVAAEHKDKAIEAATQKNAELR